MANTAPKVRIPQAAPQRAQRPKITPEQRAKIEAKAPKGTVAHLVAPLTTEEVHAVDEWRQLDVAIKKMEKDRKAIKDRLTERLHDAGAIVGAFRCKPVVELVPWAKQGYEVQPSSGETLKYVTQS